MSRRGRGLAHAREILLATEIVMEKHAKGASVSQMLYRSRATRPSAIELCPELAVSAWARDEGRWPSLMLREYTFPSLGADNDAVATALHEIGRRLSTGVGGSLHLALKL